MPVSSPEAAELAKLLENTFRSVNIGLVNEMAIICDRLGVDVWEVIEAAATKPFGFMKFTPGPGIGGHCIPLDPHYLAWKMRTLNYKTRFIDLASEINSAMPDLVAHKVSLALNDERKSVKGSRVLVLGVAYKKDIEDMRESPALDVIRLLEEHGAEVTYHDPHVPRYSEDGHERVGVALTDDVLVARRRGRDRHRPLRHRLSAPRGHGVARRRHAQRARRHAQVAGADRVAHAHGAARVNVTVVGTGYVGLVAGACLAETGGQVVCADLDRAKIDGLRSNVLPIYEPGLDALVQRNQEQGRLSFTTDVAAAVASAEVVFIAVGTPPDEDGSADLTHVLAVAETIGRNQARELVVVTKSTVPVGTAEKVHAAVAAHAKLPFHVVSNPEFLKEGAAVDDFMKPDRVVLGVESDFARSVMAELYAPFVRTGKPIIFMDLPSAEMTKYAANAMLATRISFMNEIANLCEKVGAKVDLVRKGIGSDARIGPSFLFPGPGYGGSCFPKDVKALLRTSEEVGAPMLVLRAVEEANDRQKHRLFQKLSGVLGASIKGVAHRRVGARVQGADRRHARIARADAHRGAARRRRDGRRARSGGDARGRAPPRRPDRVRAVELRRARPAPMRSSSSPTGTSTASRTSPASSTRSSGRS